MTARKSVAAAWWKLPPRELIQSIERRGLIAFGQGRVVEDRVDEISHGSFEDHHGLADVKQFGSAVADDVDPQDLAGFAVEDQLEASGGIAADLAAGDLAIIRHAHLVGNVFVG